STSRAIAGTASIAPGTASFPSGWTKSTCVSTSHSTRPATAAAYRCSGDELEARVRAEPPPDLRRRPAVRHHDVRGEVVRAADGARADAVRVDRHAFLLELADLLDREPTGDDDAHRPEARAVERVPHLVDEPRVHAGRLEVAELRPQRAVDEGLGRVEPHPPQPRAELVRNVKGGPHRVVVEVDERADVHVARRP